MELDNEISSFPVSIAKLAVEAGDNFVIFAVDIEDTSDDVEVMVIDRFGGSFSVKMFKGRREELRDFITEFLESKRCPNCGCFHFSDVFFVVSETIFEKADVLDVVDGNFPFFFEDFITC